MADTIESFIDTIAGLALEKSAETARLDNGELVSEVDIPSLMKGGTQMSEELEKFIETDLPNKIIDSVNIRISTPGKEKEIRMVESVGYDIGTGILRIKWKEVMGSIFFMLKNIGNKAQDSDALPE